MQYYIVMNEFNLNFLVKALDSEMAEQMYKDLDITFESGKKANDYFAIVEPYEYEALKEFILGLELENEKYIIDTFEHVEDFVCGVLVDSNDIPAKVIVEYIFGECTICGNLDYLTRINGFIDLSENGIENFIPQISVECKKCIKNNLLKSFHENETTKAFGIGYPFEVIIYADNREEALEIYRTKRAGVTQKEIEHIQPYLVEIGDVDEFIRQYRFEISPSYKEKYNKWIEDNQNTILIETDDTFGFFNDFEILSK